MLGWWLLCQANGAAAGAGCETESREAFEPPELVEQLGHVQVRC